MRRWRLRSVSGIALIPLLLLLAPLAALAQGPFADQTFGDTWARTDAPLGAGQVSRTYY